MNEQTAKTETPRNLKGIFQQLKEIDEVLVSPEQSLDILVNGDHPVNASSGKDLDISGSAPSMENLVTIVDAIARKSGSISKNTNRLVGN